MTKRPFNQEAYNECDLKPKQVLNQIMQLKGYTLIYGLNEDNKEKYDMIFQKENEKIIFENEVRSIFDEIKNKYNTIHIPYRKIDSIANYYLVWKNNYKEFALILFNDIKNSKTVKIKCKEPNKNEIYEELFFDVPKSICRFFSLNEKTNKWKLS